MSDLDPQARIRGGWPQRVGDVLGPALERMGPKTLWTESKVRKLWPGVVGDSIAPHAHVRRLQGTTLIVEVTSDAWATELSYLARVVIEKLTARVGSGVVTEILVAKARGGRRG